MPRRKAELRAEQLVNNAGIDGPPIPVEELAAAQGVTVSYEPFDDTMSGMLFRGEGKPIIGINSAHHYHRQRFSIAHEIGHLLLHDGKRTIFVDKAIRIDLRDENSSLGVVKEEIEANAFAAALLMPRAFIRDAISRVVERDPDFNPQALLQELAQRFKVSTEAMQHRLSSVGIAHPW